MYPISHLIHQVERGVEILSQRPTLHPLNIANQSREMVEHFTQREWQQASSILELNRNVGKDDLKKGGLINGICQLGR